MENTILEAGAVEQVADVVELNELQLALVGGGIADVIAG